MLYLVSGNNKDRKQYINGCIVEHGGDPSRVRRINVNDISEEQLLSEMVITQSGLFGDTEFFIIQDMARELPLKDLLEEYQASSNLIFFSEATITKKIENSFEKVGAEIQICSPEIKKEASSFNVFSLADALGKRDKKNLWLLFHQALANSSPEEINGILLWQIKNMIMVSDSQEVPKGMKPFVYQKNKNFVSNYQLSELKNLMRTLTKSFHERDIYESLDIKIEKMILGL